jgi:plasmid stability protein
MIRTTDVRVRNVDDWVVEWHCHRARPEGRSLEGDLRQILTDAALAQKRAITAEMRTGIQELRAAYGTFSDIAAIIREIRDERG